MRWANILAVLAIASGLVVQQPPPPPPIASGLVVQQPPPPRPPRAPPQPRAAGFVLPSGFLSLQNGTLFDALRLAGDAELGEVSLLLALPGTPFVRATCSDGRLLKAFFARGRAAFAEGCVTSLIELHGAPVELLANQVRVRARSMDADDACTSHGLRTVGDCNLVAWDAGGGYANGTLQGLRACSLGCGALVQVELVGSGGCTGVYLGDSFLPSPPAGEVAVAKASLCHRGAPLSPYLAPSVALTLSRSGESSENVTLLPSLLRHGLPTLHDHRCGPGSPLVPVTVTLAAYRPDCLNCATLNCSCTPLQTLGVPVPVGSRLYHVQESAYQTFQGDQNATRLLLSATQATLPTRAMDAPSLLLERRANDTWALLRRVSPATEGAGFCSLDGANATRTLSSSLTLVRHAGCAPASEIILQLCYLREGCSGSPTRSCQYASRTYAPSSSSFAASLEVSVAESLRVLRAHVASISRPAPGVVDVSLLVAYEGLLPADATVQPIAGENATVVVYHSHDAVPGERALGLLVFSEQADVRLSLFQAVSFAIAIPPAMGTQVDVGPIDEDVVVTFSCGGVRTNHLLADIGSGGEEVRLGAGACTLCVALASVSNRTHIEVNDRSPGSQVNASDCRAASVCTDARTLAVNATVLSAPTGCLRERASHLKSQQRKGATLRVRVDSGARRTSRLAGLAIGAVALCLTST